MDPVYGNIPLAEKGETPRTKPLFLRKTGKKVTQHNTKAHIFKKVTLPLPKPPYFSPLRYIDELETDPYSFLNWSVASNRQLEDLTVMIASGELNKVQHLSIIALITQDVHARDMIEDMVKADVSTTTDFLWSKQLRYYWDDTSGENGTCEVK